MIAIIIDGIPNWLGQHNAGTYPEGRFDMSDKTISYLILKAGEWWLISTLDQSLHHSNHSIVGDLIVIPATVLQVRRQSKFKAR